MAKTFPLILFLVVVQSKTFSQTKNSMLEQDNRVEILANEKKKLQSSLTISDKYKIQLYSGDTEIAKKTLFEFKRDFNQWDATMVFQTPVYKIWIGSFNTRLDANFALKTILKKFPKAFVFKPNKN
jgi:hypothetical protein